MRILALLFLSFSAVAAEDREAALLRAMASDANAAERAAKDTARPQFHFRAPANWMNDPNGPIFYSGFYHMFYQHNPYGDGWGHMHWGHARSKDLVHWEHLPIALWPSEDKGEKHCFSGCAAMNAKGEPMIFYTSIGHSRPECWIALPEDKDLIRWKKFEGNPILTEASPGIDYYDFRDPFVFTHEGRTYMVHGGNLNKAKGGQAVVSLYEAENPELTKWKYRGILFQHPDPKVVNIECPLFFPLDGKFVLITSPHRACDYFVGTFDPAAGKFSSEQTGMLDYSDQFYAPNTCVDERGQRILWGWVRGFKEKRGWNGCLSLPRVLSIEDGKLIQRSAPDLAEIPREQLLRSDQAQTTSVMKSLRGDSSQTKTYSMRDNRMLELTVHVAKEPGLGLELSLRESSDKNRGIKIDFDGTTLDVVGTKVKMTDNRTTLSLHIFVDHALVEVCVNFGQYFITRVVEAPRLEDRDMTVTVKSKRAQAAVVNLWELKSIW
jgi:sucrose-6-phosphate hydrolase SacC (GH32 family)